MFIFVSAWVIASNVVDLLLEFRQVVDEGCGLWDWCPVSALVTGGTLSLN